MFADLRLAQLEAETVANRICAGELNVLILTSDLIGVKAASGKTANRRLVPTPPDFTNKSAIQLPRPLQPMSPISRTDLASSSKTGEGLSPVSVVTVAAFARNVG